jgi:hypothetical protein
MQLASRWALQENVTVSCATYGPKQLRAKDHGEWRYAGESSVGGRNRIPVWEVGIVRTVVTPLIGTRVDRVPVGGFAAVDKRTHPVGRARLESGVDYMDASQPGPPAHQGSALRLYRRKLNSYASAVPILHDQIAIPLEHGNNEARAND